MWGLLVWLCAAACALILGFLFSYWGLWIATRADWTRAFAGFAGGVLQGLAFAVGGSFALFGGQLLKAAQLPAQILNRARRRKRFGAVLAASSFVLPIILR
jgi:hypothetical protein